MQLSDFDNLHTLATCAFCCITEGAGIYFQNVSEDVMKTWDKFPRTLLQRSSQGVKGS